MSLRLEHISAGYGGGTTVHRLSLTVAPGTVHALAGHNGAGKTTLLHTIAGLIRPAAGRILLGERDLTRLPAHARARAGIGYVPQGARVFASLTVAEHLTIAHPRRGGTTSAPWTGQRVLDLLPQLQRRLRHRGGQLSGGEQQMLALARALLTQPTVLLLDEPTEGLAPAVAARIRDTITTLANAGMTILLATPQPDLAADLASHHISVLTAGRLSHALEADTVRADPHRLHAALTPATAATCTATALSHVLPGLHRPAWADTLPGHDPIA